MEEDIDIEEHDVLDNPRIRDIFPDLSRVKLERDSDDEDQQQLENYRLQIKQENTENFSDNGENGEDANDNLTFGNSDNGNNDAMDGNVESILGNCDSVGNNDDSNNDEVAPSYVNDATDDNDDLIDGNSNNLSNDSHSYPNESHSHDINDFDDAKSDCINEQYTGAIIISDSDANDNLDNDLDSNDLHHDDNVENVEAIEGDDEAETSETDIHDDESIQNNKNRYRIMRELLSEQENDYIIPNKIILGSKPSKDKGKEYLKAVVLLEDWAEKLKESGCYCDQCEILFATPNALNHHKTSIHSFLIAVSHNKAVKSTAKSSMNLARKSTSSKHTEVKKLDFQVQSTSKYCHHCNTMFADQPSLIKHLYELLPTNQFCCILCKMKFNTQKELKKHNATHRVIPKIAQAIEIKDTEPRTTIPKVGSAEGSTNDNYQFKCKICHEIFNTYYSCSRHRKEKHPASANKMIFLKIKVKTKSIMSVPNNEQKLPVINKEIEPDNDPILVSKSTLFQCKNCKLHFLSGLDAVLHKVCNVIHSLCICSICNRRFRNEDRMLHKRQHEHSSKFRVYFIVPDLYHKILCRCPDCNLHFEEKLFKAHFKNCSKIPSEECKQCKILVPKTRLIEHTKKHYYLNLKPKDFILITYISEKNLKRKIPGDFIHDTSIKKLKLDSTTEKKHKYRLFYCEACECCMKKAKLIHTTKKCYKTTERIVCTHCGLTFTTKSHKMHSKIHKERKLTVRDFEIVSVETNEVIRPPIPSYPQCLKCNIKFFRSAVKRRHICGEDYETCNICGDSYHSADLQAHVLFHDKPIQQVKIMPELLKKYEMLNAMWNIVFYCNICNVLTDTYDKCVEHSQAHINKQNIIEQSIKCYICNMKFYESCWSKHTELHSRMKITNKDFKILSFDPKKLLSESWFQIFESLPEQETNQIIDSSVYGHERAVKMKLKIPGRSEFTLYICSNCKICIEQTDIQNHVEGVCSQPEYVCEICNIYFADEICLLQHQDLHAKGINKEEFRIVFFEVKRQNANLKYSLFKCKLCGACVNLRHSIKKHTCPKRKVTCYCELCNQSFVYQVMLKHELRHKADPNFRAENINIIPFYPKAKNGSNKNGLTKKIYKVKAPKMTNQNKVLDAEVDTEKIDVYKCIKCKVCILFKMRLANHICLPANRVFACKKCKQLFPTCTMPRHLTRHRNNATFQAKNLKIINFSSNNNTITYYESESSSTKDKLVKKSANKSIDTSSIESSSTKINLTINSSKNNQNETLSAIFYNGTGEPLTDKKYVFYKCIDCNLCLSRRFHCNHRCLTTDAFKHYCNICEIFIYVRYRQAHEKNHEDDPDLNSDNIEVIEFKRPPTTKKAQESDLESESRIDSDVEMKTENESNVDETPIEQSDELITLHKCKDCKVCLCSIQKANRIRHQCVTDDKKTFCEICLEYFNNFRIKSHRKLHKERNLGADNFRIVPFKSRNSIISKKLTFEQSDNNESDAETESKIDDDNESRYLKDDSNDKSETYTEDLDQESESVKEDYVESDHIVQSYNEITEIDIQDDDGVENKTKLYKCSKCNICIHLKASIDGHTCPIKPSTFFCKKCKQHFSKTMIKTHKLKHKMFKNLVASKIKIVKFKPLDSIRVKKYSVSKKSTSWQRGEIPKRKIYKKEIKNSEQELSNSAKIFKCDCGLHFTSEKSIKNHLVICKDDLEISKENCSKCGLLFPTGILVSHLCKHHSKNTEIIVENYSETLKHSETLTNDETEIVNEAPTENRTTEMTTDNNLSMATKNTDLDVSETAEKTERQIQNTKKNKVKPDIYKCQECNVYYINQNTCYKHVLKHEKLDPKSYIECKLCGLQFTIMTLMTHMRIHHSKPFDLDKIMVEIYYPVEKNKPLKKELYCAGDRVQSLLVSSSNDNS